MKAALHSLSVCCLWSRHVPTSHECAYY